MNTRTKNRLINDLDQTDKYIIDYLKSGFTQKEISDRFIALGIKPNSLSIIEKRLKAMREKLGAKTNFHLAIILYGN